MIFNKEADFEEAIIKILSEKGWEKEVLKNYTENDLLRNWADILYENNRDIDRLNDYPLTNSEMQQILEQIENLRTPLKLNGFINGKSVSIVRDNPNDKLHFGKEVSLKIYDRREIAAGQSRYQIVQQPKFPTKSKLLNDRRGDLVLLINGMPVIHIELKKSGIPVSQACNQIEKYSHEGIFSGLFSLVQIFVAMEPNEAVYFANPGPDGKFNPDYYFHWADYNNEPINDWDKVASTLLSIPMAHQLIGFYTVADDSEQKYANIFLHDIQRGDVEISDEKILIDYINEYMTKAKDDQIHRVAMALGVDEVKLRNLMSLKLNATNINEFGRYDDLKKTVNKDKAKEYFEKIEGTKIIPPKVNVKVDNLLREFILGGGMEIPIHEINKDKL